MKIQRCEHVVLVPAHTTQYDKYCAESSSFSIYQSHTPKESNLLCHKELWVWFDCSLDCNSYLETESMPVSHPVMQYRAIS